MVHYQNPHLRLHHLHLTKVTNPNPSKCLLRARKIHWRTFRWMGSKLRLHHFLRGTDNNRNYQIQDRLRCVKIHLCFFLQVQFCNPMRSLRKNWFLDCFPHLHRPNTEIFLGFALQLFDFHLSLRNGFVRFPQEVGHDCIF